MSGRLPILIAVSVFVAVGSAHARDLLAPEREIIQSAIKSQMKDPDSARIEFLPFTEAPHDEMFFDYCAVVNGRNSYGGYTGGSLVYLHVAENRQRQIVYAMAKGFASRGDEGMTIAVTNACRRAGY